MESVPRNPETKQQSTFKFSKIQRNINTFFSNTTKKNNRESAIVLSFRVLINTIVIFPPLSLSPTFIRRQRLLVGSRKSKSKRECIIVRNVIIITGIIIRYYIELEHVTVHLALAWCTRSNILRRSNTKLLTF